MVTKKQSFNRSAFTTSLHDRAKQRKEFYESVSGGKKLPYNEYLKTDSLVNQQIVLYKLQFSADYDNQGFQIPQEVIYVYAIRNEISETKLVDAVKQSVAYSKSSKSGIGFADQMITNLISEFREPIIKVQYDKEDVTSKSLSEKKLTGIQKQEVVEIDSNLYKQLVQNRGVYLDETKSAKSFQIKNKSRTNGTTNNLDLNYFK